MANNLKRKYILSILALLILIITVIGLGVTNVLSLSNLMSKFEDPLVKNAVEQTYTKLEEGNVEGVLEYFHPDTRDEMDSNELHSLASRLSGNLESTQTFSANLDKTNFGTIKTYVYEIHTTDGDYTFKVVWVEDVDGVGFTEFSME